MDKRELNRNVFAAMFLIGGIVLILGVVLYIGQGRGLAQSRFPVQVLFRNVGGLNEGAQILLSGVNVGTVQSIDFLEKDVKGRRVSVLLSVYKKYKTQLAKSTRIAIKTQGILGDKLVEIYVDANKPMVDLSQPIIGADPMDVQDLTEVFVNAAESFTKTSEDLNNIDINGLTNMLQETSKSLLVTSRGINAILEDLDEVTRKSKRLLDRVELRVIDGNLFKVF